MKKTLIILFTATIISFLLLIGLFYIFPEYTFTKIVELQREKAGLKLLSVDVSGTKIKYLRGGVGEDLVLLHGFGANKDNWTKVSEYITPHFRITAPDLTGFGESDKPNDADYSIEAQMERVKIFVDAIGIKSFHLGGNSMGGYISALFASKYKNRIKSLWLVSPGGVYSSLDSDMYNLLKTGKNPLIVENTEDFKNLYNFVFYKKPFIPEPFIKKLAQRAISDNRLNRKIFMDLLMKPVSIENALEGCEIPTLILWGKEDRVLHWTGAAILEKKMVNAKTAILENTGHLPMIEKSVKSAKIFLLFHSKSL